MNRMLSHLQASAEGYTAQLEQYIGESQIPKDLFANPDCIGYLAGDPEYSADLLKVAIPVSLRMKRQNEHGRDSALLRLKTGLAIPNFGEFFYVELIEPAEQVGSDFGAVVHMDFTIPKTKRRNSTVGSSMTGLRQEQHRGWLAASISINDNGQRVRFHTKPMVKQALDEATER